jgi:molybdopterin/thiamine biosynthesis adenylyltransferase
MRRWFIKGLRAWLRRSPLPAREPQGGTHERIDIVVRRSDWELLQSHLFPGDGLEHHAFLFAGHARTNRGTRLLVRDVTLTGSEGYEIHGAAYLRLTKEHFRAALRRCYAEHLSLIELHCHPFGDSVGFSDIDRRNEDVKFPYVARKIPEIRHATMVCSPTGAVYAHAWDPARNDVVRIHGLVIVGDMVEYKTPDGHSRRTRDALRQTDWRGGRYDRQVLAFGNEGQSVVNAARVGVVGVGGNGSPLVQTLAHAGVREFVLVDPDKVAATNLNRLIGAVATDVGSDKVRVLERVINQLHDDATVTALPVSVFNDQAVEALKEVDVLVGATDSMAARLALSILSSRYLIPYIDTGVHVEGEDGKLAQCFGQVHLTQPDGPCLSCLGRLDGAAAARELLTPEERAMRTAAGYGTGMTGPVPSLAPVNGIIANVAALRVLGMITGAIAGAPYWYLDLAHPRLQSIAGTRDDQCTICGEHALGDLLPWPRFGSSSLPRNIPSREAVDAG